MKSQGVKVMTGYQELRAERTDEMRGEGEHAFLLLYLNCSLIINVSKYS